MLFADNLATVPTVASTQRTSVTPSKLVVRNSTPQRTSSNPRLSTSAGKIRPVITFVEREDTLRPVSRSMSRRKQRRWENSNLFDVEVNDVLTKDILDGGEDEGNNKARSQKMTFHVDLGSAFKELFAPENASALDVFRRCAENSDYFSSSSAHHRRSPNEKAWINVEKRLRQIVSQSILKNADILQYLSEMEELVVNFATFDDVCIGDSDSASELPLLQSILLQTPFISTDRAELEVCMKDSAFHRLLLHCVCQFHGLKSKSYVSGNKKTTMISKTSQNVQERVEVSLTKYLLERATSGLLSARFKQQQTVDCSFSDRDLHLLEVSVSNCDLE